MSRRVRVLALLAIVGSIVAGLLPARTLAAEQWSATFDFTTGEHGWSRDLFYAGDLPGWYAGSGWGLGGDGGFGISILRYITGGDTTTYLTSVAITVRHDGNPTGSLGGDPPTDAIEAGLDFSDHNFSTWQDFPYPSGGTVTFGSLNSRLSGALLKSEVRTHGNNDYSYGNVFITGIRITGYGTPPDVDLDPTALPGDDGTMTGICKVCTYNPTGDLPADLPLLMNYLACQIGNIYFCVVVPILLGIWRTVWHVFLLMQASFFWLKSLFEQMIGYAAHMTLAVAYYLNGSIQNAGNNVVNATIGSTRAYFMTGSGSNLFDAIIALFNNLGGVFTGIVNAINGLGTAIVQALSSVLHDTFGFLIALINGIVSIAALVMQLIALIASLVATLFNSVMGIIMIIPRLIATIQTAMTQTTSDPVGALNGLNGLSCSNDIVSYYCTAGYVMDNTILGARMQLFGLNVPIVTTLIQVIMFFIGLDRLLWAIRRFQALSGAGNESD
jgi:hypothetical protein